MTPQTVPIGIATAPRLTAAESDRSRRPIPIPHTPLRSARVRRGACACAAMTGAADLGARRGAHPCLLRRAFGGQAFAAVEGLGEGADCRNVARAGRRLDVIEQPRSGH